MITPEDLISQAPHFDPKIAEEWLASTLEACEQEVEIDGDYVGKDEFESQVASRMKWQVRLLNGFGPSDIGILYIEHQGGFSPFDTTAADVVRSKFGMSAPQASLGDIERSRFLKPVAEKKFLRQMADKDLSPMPEAKRAIYEYLDGGGDPDHPWMTGLPNGVFKDRSGEVWLVNFTVPRTHESCVTSYEFPSMGHRAQLALHKMILERAGIEVHHTVVCPLSVKTMECMPSEVQIKPDFEKGILEAGDHYWGLVQKHETPSFVPKNAFENIPAEDLPEDSQKLIFRFAYFKKIEGMAKKEAEKAKESMREVLMEQGICLSAMKKTRIPLIDISEQTRTNFDANSAKAYIEELGGDPENERLYRNSVTQTIQLIRGKSSPYAADINRVQEVATRVMLDGELDIAEELGHEDLAQSSNATDPRDNMEDQKIESVFDGFGSNEPLF